MGAGGEGDKRLPAGDSQVPERRHAGSRRRLWWLGLMALLTLLLAVAVILLSESAAAQTGGNIWLEGTPVAGGTVVIHAPDFCPYQEQAPPTPLPPGRFDATPPPTPPVTGTGGACAPGSGAGGGLAECLSAVSCTSTFISMMSPPPRMRCLRIPLRAPTSSRFPRTWPPARIISISPSMSPVHPV